MKSTSESAEHSVSNSLVEVLSLSNTVSITRNRSVMKAAKASGTSPSPHMIYTNLDKWSRCGNADHVMRHSEPYPEMMMNTSSI